MSSSPTVSAFFLRYNCCILPLLYYCSRVYGQFAGCYWWMGFSPVLLCCTAVLRATAVLLYSTRWVGGSVRGCVHGFVRGWMRSGCVGSYYVVDGVLSFRDHVRGEPVFFCFLARSTGPALA